jgi:signal transduction histidine kinase/CheY-like chemotaxis protein/HPt (histidine-containing phosphotransfer) domain-containing protein/putative methionine-R-sulfoxide reductase with GAF domain
MIKIKNQLDVLKRLNHFAQCIGKIQTIEDLATSVSQVLDDLLDIEASGLYLYDFEHNRLKLLVAKGFTEDERREADRTAMERHPGYVFKTGLTLDIPDTENDTSSISLTSKRSFIVRSRLYIPVLNGNEPVGAFGIVSKELNWFNEEYQVVLSFICSISGGIYATILHDAEQQKARRHLEAITIRLDSLIKNLQSGILVEDQFRKIALINQAFCNMFGIPVEPELLTGSDCSDSAEQSRDMFVDPAQFVSRIETILHEKRQVTGEELELKDGRIFDRDYIPIFLDGKFLGNLWQYRDITTRVTIEKDLRKAMDEARSSTMAKSTFLANMSHEIRTPLNAVVGLSRLMDKTSLNSEQKTLNDKLMLSGETLLGIINEILDFSKIEAGRVDLENIPFSLNDLLSKVYGFISHAAEEKAIGLSCTTDLLFSKPVIGDPVRLQQVMINLLNNAIKFTSDGGVDLTCTLLSESPGHAVFLFSVKDTGIGISEDNLINIFDKFRQEDESVTRVYGGTGLGLAISRQLVNLMGGTLKVESEKGIGSRFFFTLEFSTTDVALLHETNRKVFIDPEILRGKTILVVEDNELNQFIACSILGKWNISTDVAINGRQAIEKVKKNQYDLILMDMQMPVMDGLTATRFIRNELSSPTPVIALTAFATKEAVEKAMNAGMNGFVTKPFDEETLYSRLLTTFGLTPRYISDSTSESAGTSPKARVKGEQFDLNKLSRLLCDDQDEILDLIEKFIRFTPEYSLELYQAYDQNNIEEVARAAHKIKSSLELLASGNLRSNIQRIHEYSRSKEHLDRLPKLLHYYRENIPLFMEQLREKAAELKASKQ